MMVLACSSENPKKKVQEGFFNRLAKTPSVTIVSITPKEIPLVIKASGKTEAADRFEAKAPARVKVTKIFVEEGAKVAAGDNLVRFDYEEVKLRLAKAKAELKESDAGIENETFLQRNKDKLIEQNKMTDLEGEMVDKRLALYQAIQDRARTEVDLYEKTGEWTDVNSPIAGVVLKKYLSDGALVEENQSIVDVVRLDPIKFVFSVPVEYAAAINKEAEIMIKMPIFPNQEFKGESVQVSADIQKNGNGVEVKVDLANPELQIKTDLRGDVIVHTKARKKIYPIAESALLKTEKSVFVFKIDGDKVKKFPVELGSEPYNNQPVIEKGVAEGDKVVISELGGLKDGTRVEIESVPSEK